MKRLPLLLAAFLTGCATAPNDEPRIGLIVGLAVAAVVIAGSSGNDDEEEPPVTNTCRTIIRPNPGGGLGTNVTIC